MRVLVTGYSYIYQRFFKMFDYFPEEFQFVFVLPAVWRAKQGKVIYRAPESDKYQVITQEAYFSHSNYPLVGGLFKGWQPGFGGALKKYLQQEKIDLVYAASEPHLMSTCFYCQSAQKHNLKIILFSWENISFRQKFSGWKLKIFEKIIKKNLKMSKGLFCGNEAACQIFDNYNHKIKKTICPISGVDTELFRPSERNSDKTRFLFAGAIGQRKGIFLIVEVFANLVEKYNNLELIICGSGEDEDKLQKLIKEKGLSDFIKIFPWLDSNQLAEKFGSSDVFLYPSLPEKGWAEQFGFSMVEAQAAGLPVIATRIGSISEVVKDQETGLLIKPGDHRELSVAMEKLHLNKKLRQEMGRAGRRWALDNFSYQKVAEKMAKFFKEVANE